MKDNPAKSYITVDEKYGFKLSWHSDIWLIAVLVYFTLFAWANWGKVAAPIIDVGREVEIPARIVDGQLLYRDVVSFYGPLAYYANALVLRFFGHHLEVFYAVGLVLALVATLLFYRLAKRLMNAPWAALCTVCMLIECAIGSEPFHFILPYSYGAVYAIVFCLLAITFIDCYGYTGKMLLLIFAAIACGLAGLAKQEYGVAALGSVLVGANLYSTQNIPTRAMHSLLIVVVAATTTILPLALIAQQGSWHQIYLWLLPIPKLGVMNRSTTFQLSPVHTLYCWWSALKVFIPTSAIVVVSVLASHTLLKPKRKSPKNFRSFLEVIVGIAISVCGIILLNQSSFFKFYSYLEVFQPLHFLSWSLPLLVGWFAINRPQLPENRHAPLMWALLVLVLLLNARWLFCINFYGLYVWPVILLFFMLLYYLDERTNGVIWRYSLVCLLISVSLNTGILLTQFPYAVNSSYGTFYTPNAVLARAFNQTINAIQTSGSSSVLVLPEGNILNFLTATHSPSREVTFFPTVLTTAQDEQEFVTRMQANPPDLIVYLPRTFSEWGYQTYAEFNPVIDQWITQKHRLLHAFPMDGGAIRIYGCN